MWGTFKITRPNKSCLQNKSHQDLDIFLDISSIEKICMLNLIVMVLERDKLVLLFIMKYSSIQMWICTYRKKCIQAITETLISIKKIAIAPSKLFLIVTQTQSITQIVFISNILVFLAIKVWNILQRAFQRH